jgi:protein-L-isoaspartate(D-aspartate) O-methyltransferase
MHSAADNANQRMVDRLIVRGALWSRALIEAFRTTPRHRFLDRIYQLQEGTWHEIVPSKLGRQGLKLVYTDQALTTRLSEGVPISSSSQPSLMARMLEELRLRPGLRILEVGAGTGYNAALLARIVGAVVSVDVDRRVLAEAEEHLRAFPDRQVDFRHGDGRKVLPGEDPFDRIQVTAASPDLEPAWLDQLAEGGLVQVPLSLAPGLAFLVRGTVRAGRFEGRLTQPAYFMSLRDEGETGSAALSALPSPESLPALAAPWASAARHLPVGDLLQALAFLGYLQDGTVSQVMLNGEVLFGVGDLVRGRVCWFGPREWRVTGPEGRALGRHLWQLFLDTGGPMPTEFRLLRSISAGREAISEDLGEARLLFQKQGARGPQLWVLPEERERPVRE